MLKNDESSLELVMPVLVKVSDHFLMIRKKMDLTLNLEVGSRVPLGLSRRRPLPVFRRRLHYR